jgi:hypothetical protein
MNLLCLSIVGFVYYRTREERANRNSLLVDFSLKDSKGRVIGAFVHTFDVNVISHPGSMGGTRQAPDTTLRSGSSPPAAV